MMSGGENGSYYYFKSADWKGNNPFPLKDWTASELAKMPTYYIMDLSQGVAAIVAEHQPTPAEIAACQWMTEADLQVYTREFERTGFQRWTQLLPHRWSFH
jgi:hypothetical protein